MQYTQNISSRIYPLIKKINTLVLINDKKYAHFLYTYACAIDPPIMWVQKLLPEAFEVLSILKLRF